MKLVKKTKMEIADINMDYLIYPRQTVDRVRVNEYASAIQSGAKFPPVRICEKTHKVADGFHRIEAYKKLKMEAISVELYTFENEQDLIWHSIFWNAQHGLSLSKYDQSRCINLGREYGISDEHIATALCITIEKITKMERERIRFEEGTGKPVEVKKVISNITSTHVTSEQIRAQKPFNAMPAEYNIKRSIDALICNLLPLNENNISDVKKLEDACHNWLEQSSVKVS